MQIGLSPVLTESDSPRMVPLQLPWWYRADAVTLVSSKASVVKDLSGNGADSLQGVDANRFVWSATSGPNNTPGLASTGTQFSATAGNVDLSLVTQLTVIVVFVPNTIPVGAATLVTNKLASGTNEGFNLIAFEAGGQDVYRNLACTPPISAPFSETSSANPAAPNTPVIIESTYDQTLATNQTNIWLNGVLNAQTRVINNQSTGGFQSLVLTMGDGTNGCPGAWAECFAYAGLLSAQERQNLYRGYLSPRYGITVP